MADETQNDNPIDPATVFVKRKRGRPRKDGVPGSEAVRRKPYRRGEQSVQFGDVSVGQTVSGVLDGKFDAGYMITVQAGNSGTVLTGVVFEQGRSVPVTPANDVAPNIEMLKRVEVPIPSSRCQSQPIPKRDNVGMHSMESSIRSMPEDLNVKHPLDPCSVSNNASEVVHSGLTLTTPSSISIHGIDSRTQIHQNELSAPKPLIPEPMQIKAAVTPGSELVHSEGTIKNSPMDVLPSASEPMNMSSLTLTTPSSVSIHGFDRQTQINQNAVIASKPSVSEPTEIKGTVTSDRELVHLEGKIKNSPMDILPSVSEPANVSSLTLTTPSSVSIPGFASPTQINQNVISAPKSSVFEPMEIKATATSDKEVVQSKGTIENSPTDSLTSASETMNMRNLTLTTPSSISIHGFPSPTQVNQSVISSPKSSFSEPMEIKATAISDKELVRPKGTIEISPMDSLLSASESMNMRSLTLTTQSSVSIHGFASPTQINQNVVSAPKSSVPELKEIKATVTSDKELVHPKGTIENSPMGSLPSASDPMNVRTIETPNDGHTKELLPDPTVTPQVPIHDPEHDGQSTRDLLGRKTGYLATVEPSVESSGDKHAEDYLSANLSTEVRSPMEQNTDLISQGLETRCQPKIQSQLPMLDLQTFPSVPASEQLHSHGIPTSGDRQPTDVTESSKDVGLQEAAGDRA